MFANRGLYNHSTFSAFNSPPKSNFIRINLNFSKNFTVFCSPKKIELLCAFRRVALLLNRRQADFLSGKEYSTRSFLIPWWLQICLSFQHDGLITSGKESFAFCLLVLKDDCAQSPQINAFHT